MSRRKLYRIIIEAVAGILLIFVLVFFLGFRVTSVQVEGNSFYTDDQIKIWFWTRLLRITLF